MSAPTNGPAVQAGWTATDAVLAALYGIVSVAATIMLVRIRRVVGRSTVWQQTFYILLLTGSLLKAFVWAISPFIYLVNMKEAVFFVFADFPAKMYVSCYLTLGLFWVLIYYRGENNRWAADLAVRAYFVFNFVLYAVVFSLYVANIYINPSPLGDNYDFNKIELACQGLDSVYYFVVGSVFAIFVRGVMRGLATTPLMGRDIEVRNTTVKRVRILVVTSVACSYIRCVVVVLSNIEALDSINNYFWFILLFYLVLDILPIFLILAVLQTFGSSQERGSLPPVVDDQSPLMSSTPPRRLGPAVDGGSA